MSSVLAENPPTNPEAPYLYDGEYSIFDAVKEGLRSIQRTDFCDSKITGGIGEILRDKWYKDGYRFHDKGSVVKHYKTRLLQLFCRLSPHSFDASIFTDSFQEYIVNTYRSSVSRMLDEDFSFLQTDDVGYLYLYSAWRHYIQSWLGTLYGGHGRILLCSAPYLFKPLVEYVLARHHKYKKDAFAQIAATLRLCPTLGRIPLIDGQPFQIRDTKNAWKFIVAETRKQAQQTTQAVLSRLFRLPITLNHKRDYDYQLWLKDILSNETIRGALESLPESAVNIFDKSKFDFFIKKGLHGHLSNTHYRMLSRLITLAISCHIAKTNVST